MKPLFSIVLAMIGAIGLVSCSDTPESLEEVPTTLPDLPSTLPGSEDVQALIADIQAETADIAAEIENSEAREELQSAWDEIEAQIQSAIDSASENGSVDTSGIEQQLDEFEDTLRSLGDDVSDELMSSWNELRAAFEQLIS